MLQRGERRVAGSIANFTLGVGVASRRGLDTGKGSGKVIQTQRRLPPGWLHYRLLCAVQCLRVSLTLDLTSLSCS